MTSLTLTIRGEPASKANARRAVIHPTGRLMWIKSEKALKYLKHFRPQVLAQLTPPLEPLTGALSFTATIYYKTERPDLDASLILDALEGLAYKNDRQVREIHLYHRIDKQDPRAEITIAPIAGPLFQEAVE
ncbi:MAG: RusA family crossover junction endodeoxyribonuclease [Geminicoccaceae bacterium]